MSILDPLRPYAALLRVVGWLLLASVLLFGGCSWGRSIEKNKAAGAIAAKNAALVRASTALQQAADTLKAIDRATGEAEARAKEAARQADAAVDRAAKAEKTYQQRLAAEQAAIDRAKRDPDCRKLLETKSCAVLR